MQILIDTNIYLTLFISTRLLELLPALEEARPHVFVSRQVVHEVDRNKARIVSQFLGEQVARARSMQPLGFLDMAAVDGAELENRANAYLASVAASKDRVSRTLRRVFKGAAEPSAEQMERARLRRERGDSPGKSEDALGDQLTWEMWLDHAASYDRVWIVTNDQDYFTRFGGSRYLNPLLQADLDRVHGGTLRAHVFDRLSEGLADFRRSAGDMLPSLPSDTVIAEMAREERGLRARGPSTRCPNCGTTVPMG